MHVSPFSTIGSSATLVINSLALAKKARGERVYNLSAGEPVLPVDQTIEQAAIAAIGSGKTLYPPVAGIEELRLAFVGWMKENYGADYSLEESLVTCGGKFGLFAFFQAFITVGSEVLIVAPYWVSYPSMVRLFGGVPVVVPTDAPGWKVTVELLERYVTARTKIISLNNAANPTGVVYTREELGNILRFAAERDLLVVSDEVYSGLVYDNHSFVSAGSFPEFKERVVIIQSCSKHFAMTGWRVGFVLAPQNIIAVLTMLQSQSTTGTASVSQWAALAAVHNAERIVPSVRAAMQARRDVFVERFSALFSPLAAPASALYAFVPQATLSARAESSAAFCERVLAESNVALVPGSAFGQEGYVRFSFGDREEEIVAGLEALHDFLDRNV